MPQPVTVGVDGSPESRAAAEWAACEAARWGLPLRLIHVWEWLAGNAQFALGPDAQKHWVAGRLRATRAEISDAYPGLAVSSDQVAGKPVTELLEASEQSDLMVLGCKGLGPVSGFLYGSVSLQVIARTEKPVVVVRAAEGPDTDVYGVVVLGLDFRSPCDPLLQFAFEESAARGSRLQVVHTWRQPPAFGYAAPLDPELVRELQVDEERALTRVLGPWHEKFPRVDVDSRVSVGSPAQHLVEAASTADLLVVGRRKRRTALGAHIGHVTHGVLHHALSPVVVVPHD